MAVEIFMQKILVDGGVRFDLVGKNIPENFLGLAVGLKFDGLKAADYQDMQWGNAFGSFAEGNLPIKMVKNDLDNGNLIVGITLRADDLKTVRDGVLGSFFFKGKDLEKSEFVSFDHQVFSVYQNGRIDLNDVKWLSGVSKKLPSEVVSSTTVPAHVISARTDQKIESSAIVPKKTTSTVVKVAEKPIYTDIPDLEESFQSDLTSQTLAELHQADLSPKNQAMDSFWWYLGGAMIGLIILCVLAWIYLRKKAKSPALFNAAGGVGLGGGFA